MSLPSGIHPRTGKLGRVQISGLAIRMKLWRLTPEISDHDVTNFEGAGFEEGVGDITACAGTFSGEFDASQNPFDIPPALVPGSVLLNAFFFVSTIDGTFWNFPQIRVITIPSATQIKGTCTLEVNWRSNGPFFAPTGSF